MGHFDDCKTKSDGTKKFFNYADMIRAYELEYDEWVRINDEYGQFVIEMIQKDKKNLEIHMNNEVKIDLVRSIIGDYWEFYAAEADCQKYAEPILVVIDRILNYKKTEDPEEKEVE